MPLTTGKINYVIFLQLIYVNDELKLSDLLTNDLTNAMLNKRSKTQKNA